jgi:hypothetical protein
MRIRYAAHGYEGSAIKAVVLAECPAVVDGVATVSTTQTGPNRPHDRRIIGRTIKDARRIATQYDTPAKTYRNTICPMAIVYWRLT